MFDRKEPLPYPRGNISRHSRPPRTLSRHLLQVRKRRVDRAGTGLAGVLDHAVEPAVNIENGAFARAAITAVGFARGKAQAADIAPPPADGTLHRLGHRGVMHADG